MSGRLIRSSSLGGSADVLGRYKPVAPQEIRQATRHAYFVPPKAAAAAAAEDPRKCIFTFTSPPRDDDPKSSGRENFLDACGLCKKRIPQNKDTYMYGYVMYLINCAKNNMMIIQLQIKFCTPNYNFMY